MGKGGEIYGSSMRDLERVQDNRKTQISKSGDKRLRPAYHTLKREKKKTVASENPKW